MATRHNSVVIIRFSRRFQSRPYIVIGGLLVSGGFRMFAFRCSPEFRPSGGRSRGSSSSTSDADSPGGGPALAIRASRDVTWAKETFSIGVYKSKSFLGPKHSFWGSASRGGRRTVRPG